MKVNFIILFLMVSYLFLHSCSLDNMGFDIESDSEEVIVDTKSTDFSYLDRPMVLGDKLENQIRIQSIICVMRIRHWKNRVQSQVSRYQKFTYTDETSVTYTPFFIDLMDDYNQSEYYSLNNQNEASCVPDDKISEIPISVLEDIILSSSSFSVVEQKLRDYVSSHEDEKKGITIENLQILLNCYNNE